MFTIDAGGISLCLEVVPVERLLEHEETLPQTAEGLALEFKNWADLQNPIIVDHNHIVLDGNHRTFVFKKLGFRYIPVCKVDYFSEAVLLRYWFRVLHGAGGLDRPDGIVREIGGRVSPVESREALSRELEQDPLAMGMQCGGSWAVIRFPASVVKDGVSAYAALEAVQGGLCRGGAKARYVPCRRLHDDSFCRKLGEQTLVLWTPHITKDMVVKAALERRVFKPKATRHLVAARPVNVNVPVRWFRENASLEAMNERFREFLAGKRIRRFGPGQVINGRYYGEEVYVFYDVKQALQEEA